MIKEKLDSCVVELQLREKYGLLSVEKAYADSAYVYYKGESRDSSRVDIKLEKYGNGRDTNVWLSEDRRLSWRWVGLLLA